VKEPVIKYAIFSQVNGEWRDEGFYIPVADIPPEKQIAEMRQTCESENGKGTFRSFAFLDQPLVPLDPHDKSEAEADALTASKVG
jgi:hypothetical protein